MPGARGHLRVRIARGAICRAVTKAIGADGAGGGCLEVGKAALKFGYRMRFHSLFHAEPMVDAQMFDQVDLVKIGILAEMAGEGIPHHLFTLRRGEFYLLSSARNSISATMLLHRFHSLLIRFRRSCRMGGLRGFELNFPLQLINPLRAGEDELEVFEAGSLNVTLPPRHGKDVLVDTVDV